MKITYIANARLPTEKAHGIQIMKMCEAFSTIGSTITLIVPRRRQTKKLRGQSAFTYYNVKRQFRIKRLPCIDLLGFPLIPGPIAFWLQSWTFLLSTIVYSFFSKEDVVYTRNDFCSSILSFYKDVVYEAHVFPKRGVFWYKRWLKRVKKIVTISNSLKKLYAKLMPRENILVAHDGVDLKNFIHLPSKESCRKKLNIPIDKPVAVYTGHLYKWKGIDTVVDALKKIKGHVYVVGGTPQDVEKYKELTAQRKNTNITFIGHVNPQVVPTYLRAGDALLLTNPAKYKISKYYTSPLKLFEYMASKNPVLASAVPSNKEVLNDKNCIFYIPDDSINFAKKLNWMFEHSEQCKKVAQQAYKDVHDYTWEKRAQSIIDFI